MSSRETASVQSGNSSVALIESRWMEIFPVWEEQHRVAVGSEDTCPEVAADPAKLCSRPIASAPVIIGSGPTPWLMKGDPGVFLSSIADDSAGQVRTADACYCATPTLAFCATVHVSNRVERAKACLPTAAMP
jgi:hypothetical protein